jgi:hypothetical protein
LVVSCADTAVIRKAEALNADGYPFAAYVELEKGLQADPTNPKLLKARGDISSEIIRRYIENLRAYPQIGRAFRQTMKEQARCTKAK